MKMNTASSSGSRTLPSNTITNPKEDLKGITTRSGTAYQGPMIPTTSSSSLPKVVERETEVTKDMVHPTNNRSTKDVQPPVVQAEIPNQNSEPVAALIIEPVGELTLRIENEAITYNLDQTSRYSANYDQMTANKIDVTDKDCEEYSQEVLGFFDVTASGSPTPFDDPIVSTTSSTLTLFGDSDFLLFEEVDAFFKDYKPAVQHQRQVNPKIHDVIKKEVEKLLDAELIYPISNSPWVSPVHCVPRKGGFTIVKNEENELIPTRLVTVWRGTSTIVSSMVSLGIFKFPSTLVIRKKQRLPALMGHSPTVACLSVCAMRREHFKGVC
nr:reverse transcriptase domain-containing protein [Tanacetum cinerariifolium]